MAVAAILTFPQNAITQPPVQIHLRTLVEIQITATYLILSYTAKQADVSAVIKCTVDCILNVSKIKSEAPKTKIKNFKTKTAVTKS